MKKILWKAAALGAVMIVLMVLVTPVLTPNWNVGNSAFGKTTAAYLAQGDNSIDVLFLGSSQVLRGLDTAAFRDEYGIAAYTRSTAVQFPAVTYYYLKQALDHHDIRVVVSDFSNLYVNYSPDEYEPYLRYAFDYMPLSLDKLEIVHEVLKTSEEQSMLSYILPFLRYHNRWRDVTLDDIRWPLSAPTDEGYGSILCSDVKVVNHVATTYSDASAPYDETSLYWYEKIVQLCQERNVRLILLRLPRETWDPGQATADLAFAEKHNLTFYDLNREDLYTELGFNDQTDFMDLVHLNVVGARRITPWLAPILLDALSQGQRMDTR